MVTDLHNAKPQSKEIQPVHPKGDQSWLIGKDPDAGRDWGQEEKGTTGWDGWMASPTWWTWVWVNSGSWWCTGRPGVLRFTVLQRVGHDWATELNWTELKPEEHAEFYPGSSGLASRGTSILFSFLSFCFVSFHFMSLLFFFSFIEI